MENRLQGKVMSYFSVSLGSFFVALPIGYWLSGWGGFG